jgi:hypothetical protein
MNADHHTLLDLVNHSGGFCEVISTLLMRRPAVRQNLLVKPEKVGLAWRAKIAEPSSLAHQRNQELEQIGSAAERLGKPERY